MTAAQLPSVRDPAQSVGQGFFYKQILPLGTVEHPSKGNLKFSRDVLEELVKTFEGGALDQVAFTLVDAGNRHTSSPEAYRGEIRGLDLADDGLYALIDPSERGRRLLLENPRQPVSARIRVPESGPFAGRPVLEHVAATPDPVARGLQPGQWIEASADTGELIDLSNGEWVDPSTDWAAAADAAYRAWTGQSAPKTVELANTPEAKRARLLDAWEQM